MKYAASLTSFHCFYWEWKKNLEKVKGKNRLLLLAWELLLSRRCVEFLTSSHLVVFFLPSPSAYSSFPYSSFSPASLRVLLNSFPSLLFSVLSLFSPLLRVFPSIPFLLFFLSFSFPLFAVWFSLSLSFPFLSLLFSLSFSFPFPSLSLSWSAPQVRILRGLGAIQPGVNRCKLLSCENFDVLYEDCTNSR